MNITNLTIPDNSRHFWQIWQFWQLPEQICQFWQFRQNLTIPDNSVLLALWSPAFLTILTILSKCVKLVESVNNVPTEVVWSCVVINSHSWPPDSVTSKFLIRWIWQIWRNPKYVNSWQFWWNLTISTIVNLPGNYWAVVTFRPGRVRIRPLFPRGRSWNPGIWRTGS